MRPRQFSNGYQPSQLLPASVGQQTDTSDKPCHALRRRIPISKSRVRAGISMALLVRSQRSGLTRSRGHESSNVSDRRLRRFRDMFRRYFSNRRGRKG